MTSMGVGRDAVAALNASSAEMASGKRRAGSVSNAFSNQLWSGSKIRFVSTDGFQSGGFPGEEVSGARPKRISMNHDCGQEHVFCLGAEIAAENVFGHGDR